MAVRDGASRARDCGSSRHFFALRGDTIGTVGRTAAYGGGPSASVQQGERAIRTPDRRSEFAAKVRRAVSELLRACGEPHRNSLSQGRTYEDERKRAEALAEIDRVKTAFFSPTLAMSFARR
jgi:hypothetical protein